MANGVICNVTGSLLGADGRAVGLNANVANPISITLATDFSFGTGPGQVNIGFVIPRVFSGTTDVLNLCSGALLDQWSTAVVAARVCGLVINNTGADVIVAGGGSDPWITFLDGTLTLPPGGWTIAATPDATSWALTPSTACNLLMTGTSGQPYQIGFLCRNV
jgi:hypothetical protein